MSSLKAARAVLLGLLIGVMLTQVGLSLMRVEGHSMDPSLAAGELVVVLRPPLLALATAVGGQRLALEARGAVVVVPEPNTSSRLLGMGRPLIVKRVVGKPGEAVAFQRGQLLVDGEPLEEPWLHPDRVGSFSMAPVNVPAGSVFIAGDNRLPLASRDSRQFGPVPASELRGRAVARLRLPWSADGLRSPFLSLL